MNSAVSDLPAAGPQPRTAHSAEASAAEAGWPTEARARLSQLEHQLATLEERVREKDDFISMVAHELRGPLTAVKGAARTLLRHQLRFDPERTSQLLRDIDGEADRLARLLDNLLELSRVEAGGSRAVGTICLQRLLRQLVQETRQRAVDRVLRLKLQRNLPLVYADPLRVEQIVRNLLDNAIKYSPPGAGILVTAVGRAAQIEVGVRNDGPRLHPEVLEQVFERFYRGPGVDDHDRGNGLGLTICKRLVEAQGGRIWVEARPRGVIFRFTIPVAAETPA